MFDLGDDPLRRGPVALPAQAEPLPEGGRLHDPEGDGLGDVRPGGDGEVISGIIQA